MGFTVTDNLPDLLRDVAAGRPLRSAPGTSFLCARWNSSALVEEGEEAFDGLQEAASLDDAIRTLARCCLDEFGFSSDMAEWADFGFLAKARTQVVQRWPELAALDDELLVAFASLATDELEFAGPGTETSYSAFFSEFALDGWSPVLGLFAAPPSEAGWVLFERAR